MSSVETKIGTRKHWSMSLLASVTMVSLLQGQSLTLKENFVGQ